MKIPTVERCCCCVDLRTAGYILGFLGLFGHLLGIVNGRSILMNLLGVVFHSWWFHGIRTEDAKLMLPLLMLTLVGIILAFLSPFIIIAVFSFIGRKSNDQHLDKHTINEFIIGCIILYISGVIALYFLIVEYSLYKMVKEKTNRRIEEENRLKTDNV